ncbi:MAG: hypothetical protein ACOC05_07715, partial [Oceanicaulis sp.]
ARRYSLSLEQVRQIAEEEGLHVRQPSTKLTGIEALIPARLRPYAVATAPVTEEWPELPEIDKARRDYDAGLVETCIGRINREDAEDLLVFYAIPRRRPVKRDPYFAERGIA